MDDSAKAGCVSCGAEGDGRFCSQCGELRLNEKDRRLSAFVQRTFREITDVDSRFLKTVRRLVLSPGHLTAEFSRGRRKPYLGPVQLFLLVNIVYFVMQPLSSYTGYNTTLASQLNRQYYSDVLPIDRWVDESKAASNLDDAAFEAVYNNQSEILARSLVALMAPLFAVFLAVVMFDRTRYAVDHLVFSLHFFAFDLLVVHSFLLLFWSDLVRAALQVVQWLTVGDIADSGLIQSFSSAARELGTGLLVTTPYLYFAFRRFYATSRLRSAITAIVAYLAVIYMTVTYRLILLTLTLASI